jgi:hypothetical protein
MRVCEVEMCGEPHVARGLCRRHYEKWNKENYNHTRRCEVIEHGKMCGRPHKGRGMCVMHLTRHQKHGDPLHLAKSGPPPTNTYGAIHRRLRDAQGPASAYACTDCPQQASEWSYTHGCPEELTDPRGYPYCLHTEHYVPRCVPCHWKHDGKRPPLTTEEREQIRAEYGPPRGAGARPRPGQATYPILAAKYGVSTGAIKSIVHGH